METKRCADRWIGLLDADQQRQGGGLDRDRVACKWDLEKKRGAILLQPLFKMKHTVKFFFRRYAPGRVGCPDRACYMSAWRSRRATRHEVHNPRPSTFSYTQLISLSRSARNQEFSRGPRRRCARRPTPLNRIGVIQWYRLSWHANGHSQHGICITFFSTKTRKEATVKSLTASSRLRLPVPRIILTGVELPSFRSQLAKNLC